MTNRRGIIVTTITILAVLALAGLAAGLNQAAFEEGRSFWFGSGEAGAGAAALLERDAGESPLAQYIGLFGTALVVLLPFGIALILIRPDLRKRLVSYFLQGMIFALFALFLSMIGRGMEQQQALLEPVEETTSGGGEGRAAESLPQAEVPQRTAAPDWLVAGASALAAGLLVVGIYRLRKRLIKPNPLRQLGRDAEQALKGIRRGADLRDTIQRCYFEMSQTLREEHALQRNQAMTAREFETLLEQSGLPRTHVQQLTRLFEGVRYGAKTPSDADERLAVDCLSSIVQAAALGGAG